MRYGSTNSSASYWLAKRLIACLLTIAFVGAAVAQATSFPGAMHTNGNFYILREEGNGLQVWEWNFITRQWTMPQRGFIRPAPGLDLRVNSGPSARTSTDGFFATVDVHDLRGTLMARDLVHWEPGRPGTQLIQNPESATAVITAPKDVLLDRRVYVSIQHSGGSSVLREFNAVSRAWTNHGQDSTRNRPVVNAPVCALHQNHIFHVSESGKVMERWFTGNGFPWGDHGKPSRHDARYVGAPMPSNKFFMTNENGELWQRYWNGGWIWYNHGYPAWRVDSPAVAVQDGKLFAVGRWDHSGGTTRVLLQLYYGTGGQWTWYVHGTPPRTNVLVDNNGNALATTLNAVQGNVAMKGTDGNFYVAYFDWATNAWTWASCGVP